jgi:hypothetical protein
MTGVNMANPLSSVRACAQRSEKALSLPGILPDAKRTATR